MKTYENGAAPRVGMPAGQDTGAHAAVIQHSRPDAPAESAAITIGEAAQSTTAEEAYVDPTPPASDVAARLGRKLSPGERAVLGGLSTLDQLSRNPGANQMFLPGPPGLTNQEAFAARLKFAKTMFEAHITGQQRDLWQHLVAHRLIEETGHWLENGVQRGLGQLAIAVKWVKALSTADFEHDTTLVHTAAAHSQYSVTASRAAHSDGASPDEPFRQDTPLEPPARQSSGEQQYMKDIRSLTELLSTFVAGIPRDIKAIAGPALSVLCKRYAMVCIEQLNEHYPDLLGEFEDAYGRREVHFPQVLQRLLACFIAWDWLHRPDAPEFLAHVLRDPAMLFPHDALPRGERDLVNLMISCGQFNSRAFGTTPAARPIAAVSPVPSSLPQQPVGDPNSYLRPDLPFDQLRQAWGVAHNEAGTTLSNLPAFVVPELLPLALPAFARSRDTAARLQQSRNDTRQRLLASLGPDPRSAWQPAATNTVRNVAVYPTRIPLRISYTRQLRVLSSAVARTGSAIRRTVYRTPPFLQIRHLLFYD